MSTPLKELVEVIGDIAVYKDDDFVQVMVDGDTVLFMDLDNAKALAKVLRKASLSEFDEE